MMFINFYFILVEGDLVRRLSVLMLLFSLLFCFLLWGAQVTKKTRFRLLNWRTSMWSKVYLRKNLWRYTYRIYLSCNKGLNWQENWGKSQQHFESEDWGLQKLNCRYRRPCSGRNHDSMVWSSVQIKRST